ncbi:MAG: redoxin domain-containing protein [Planctomycetota bacterium]
MSQDLPVRETPIEVGDAAPDFTLKDHESNDWTLSEHLKASDVALCFYPLDFSPVCSTEMECITRDMERLEGAGLTVVGVSCDSFFVHKAWREQLHLKQTLLADMHRAVCKAYGLYWPDLNVSGRGTVIISKADDGHGTVKWVQKREISDAMELDEMLAVMG